MSNYLYSSAQILAFRAMVFAQLSLPASAYSIVQRITDCAANLYALAASDEVQELGKQQEQLEKLKETAQTTDQIAKYGMDLAHTLQHPLSLKVKRQLKQLYSLLQKLSANPELASATNRSFQQLASLKDINNLPLKIYCKASAITDEIDAILCGLERLTDHYITCDPD